VTVICFHFPDDTGYENTKLGSGVYRSLSKFTAEVCCSPAKLGPSPQIGRLPGYRLRIRSRSCVGIGNWYCVRCYGRARGGCSVCAVPVSRYLEYLELRRMRNKERCTAGGGLNEWAIVSLVTRSLIVQIRRLALDLATRAVNWMTISHSWL